MRSLGMLVLLVLAACEKEPQPLGTVHGRVTETMLEGAPDANGQGVVRTTPIGCKVIVQSASGEKVAEVATDKNGDFEVQLPVGRYEVLFDACGGEVCDQMGRHRTVDVQVTSGGHADATWTCSWNAG